MDPSNPWAEQQGNGPPSNNTPQYQPPQQPQYGDQQPQSFGQPQQYGDPHQHPLQQHPPQDQFSSQYPPQQGGLGASDGAGGFGSGLGGAGAGAGAGLGGNEGFEAPPGLPPRRSATEQALPQGQDHSHQVEVMQSYEMSREQTEDEVCLSLYEYAFAVAWCISQRVSIGI